MARPVFAAGAFFLLFCLLFPVVSAGGEGEVLFREDFDSLERWEPLTFPRIQRHSTYAVEPMDGGYCLRAESDNSASDLIFRGTFPVHEFPKVRWRWRADKVYAAGDAGTKKGDDYPLRLYVVFPFDPERAGFRERLTYRAARLLYGQYPPVSALNYIWANREHQSDVLPNAYARRSKMIILRGPEDVGIWQEEEVDILEDYRRVYGEDPPPQAGLAVMNDSDGTGDGCVSYIDFIEVRR
jgi:hypothetical protein